MIRQFKGTLSDNDIALLREFVIVVECQGLSAAEARLNKGKSAISLNLKKLETRLGMKLCLRGRGGFSLTEQGRIAHSAATQLLAELDRFGEHLASAFDTLSGSVTFYADDSFLYEFQGPIARTIKRLAAEHPRVHLNYAMTNPEQVVSAVLSGAADLGLTASPRRTELLSIQPLFTEKIGLYCGADHPLFDHDAALTLEELKPHKAVETHMEPAAHARALFQSLGFAATSPTIQARIHLILSGAYIGFIPHRVAESWVEKGALREIKAPGSQLETPCNLILRKSEIEQPGTRIFRDILLQEARIA